MKVYIAVIFLALVGSAQAKLKVASTIEPISYVVEQVGKDLVENHTLISNGRNPHTYAPTPKEIKMLNQSALFFTVGAPFEKSLIKKTSGPDIISLDKNINKRAMKNGHHQGHDHHGHDHDQEHNGDLDPHIWLSSKALKIMAENAYIALARKIPESSLKLRDNRDDFLKRIDSISAVVKESLKNFSGKSLLVFHPSFGYFCDEHGLVQVAVEMEGKSPTAKHISNIIKMARKKGVKAIFVQPQFSQRAARQIGKGIRGRLKTINALEKDVLYNMKEMARSIRDAYGK